VCIFTAAFGGAEMRPGEHRQTQVDGRRVQRIDGVRQFQPQVFVCIELPRLVDQPLREVGVDAPIARLVGIGQRRTANRFAQAHVVELASLRRQACFDIAQTLPVGQLGKSHHAKLFGTGQRAYATVAAVALNVTSEGRPGQKVHELGEQGLAGVHGSLREETRKTARTGCRRSNRHHPSPLGISRQSWLSAIRPLI